MASRSRMHLHSSLGNFQENKILTVENYESEANLSNIFFIVTRVDDLHNIM